MEGVRNALYLCIGVKDHTKVAHCRHSVDALLVHVAGALPLALTNVEVSQSAPQAAHVVGELAQARADDGVRLEGLHLIRVFGDEVTQLHPQLVVCLFVLGHEAVVVDDDRKLLGGLAIAPHGDEVLNETDGSTQLNTTKQDA